MPRLICLPFCENNDVDLIERKGLQMAGSFYIRRGTKKVGPISIGKIKANLPTNKVLPTDLIAASPDGPWSTVSDFFRDDSATLGESSKAVLKSDREKSSKDIPVFFGRIGYVLSMFGWGIIYSLIVSARSSTAESSELSNLILGQFIYYLVATSLCALRLIHIGWNPFFSLIFAAPLIFSVFLAMVQLQFFQAYTLIGLSYGISGIFYVLCQILPKNYARTKELDLGGKIVAVIYCVLGLISIISMLSGYV